MTAIFGFTDRDIAKRLSAFARRPQLNLSKIPADDCERWLFYTPAGGIGAFEEPDTFDIEAIVAGTTAWPDEEIPQADCYAIELFEDTDSFLPRRRLALDGDGDPLVLPVCNLLSVEIPEFTLIGASRFVGGLFVVDWMACE